MLDIPGGWVWICDERSSFADTFMSDRPLCHNLARNESGAYRLTRFLGVRDFHISLKKAYEPNSLIVFKVEGANINPDQPKARGFGCGETVEAK